MPTLPWVATGIPPDGDVLVMASRLNLTSFSSVFGFFRASIAIRKQVKASPGALGVSLIAHPAQKCFLTLSAWTSQDALNRFVAKQPHRNAMKKYRAKMNHPVFVTWTMPAAQLPPSWSEAHEHLEHDANRIVK